VQLMYGYIGLLIGADPLQTWGSPHPSWTNVTVCPPGTVTAPDGVAVNSDIAESTLEIATVGVLKGVYYRQANGKLHITNSRLSADNQVPTYTFMNVCMTMSSAPNILILLSLWSLVLTYLLGAC
jgi:hypothetical protein